MSIEFRCYRCRSLLRVASAKAGQLIQCGKCKYTLQLQPPSKDAALRSDQIQTWRTLPPPPPPGAVQATPDTERYWQDVSRETVAAQQSNLPAFREIDTGFITEDSYATERQLPREVRRPRRRSKGQGLQVLQTLLALVAGIAFLFCGGIVILAIAYNPYMATATLRSSGFAVDAPGVLRRGSSMKQSESQAAVSWNSGSLFEIGLYRSSDLGGVTIDHYVAGIKAQGASNVHQIQRAGRYGVHYSMSSVGALPPHEAEVFPVSAGLLIVVYVCGSDAKAATGKTTKLSPEQCRKIDKPDLFFDSLRADQ